MSYKFLILIAFLILPTISFARLGETEEENQTRYGLPVKDVRNTSSPILKSAINKTYHYQGWQIRIGYINGHSVRMFYGKLPKSGQTQVLKADEIEAVLTAEVHGGKWRRLKFNPFLASTFGRKISGNKLFDRALFRWANTNNCLAYSTNRMNLYVESPEAVIWEQALVNEKEVKRKESIPQF